MKLRFVAILSLTCLLLLPAAQAQETVRAIAPATRPLPPEEASASVTRFSYLVYGDTRGRRDGIDVQYEHSLVVDGVLEAIKRLEATDYPVRFIMQTGDAVFNGGDPHQWNTSFVGLINRLTTEGGVPYFLAPGNHDVTTAPAPDDPGRRQLLQALDDPGRQQALRNY